MKKPYPIIKECLIKSQSKKNILNSLAILVILVCIQGCFYGLKSGMIKADFDEFKDTTMITLEQTNRSKDKKGYNRYGYFSFVKELKNSEFFSAKLFFRVLSYDEDPLLEKKGYLLIDGQKSEIKVLSEVAFNSYMRRLEREKLQFGYYKIEPARFTDYTKQKGNSFTGLRSRDRRSDKSSDVSGRRQMNYLSEMLHFTKEQLNLLRKSKTMKLRFYLGGTSVTYTFMGKHMKKINEFAVFSKSRT